MGSLAKWGALAGAGKGLTEYAGVQFTRERDLAQELRDMRIAKYREEMRAKTAEESDYRQDRLKQAAEGRAEERAIAAEGRAEERTIAAEGRAEKRARGIEERAASRAETAEAMAHARAVEIQNRDYLRELEKERRALTAGVSVAESKSAAELRKSGVEHRQAMELERVKQEGRRALRDRFVSIRLDVLDEGGFPTGALTPAIQDKETGKSYAEQVVNGIGMFVPIINGQPQPPREIPTEEAIEHLRQNPETFQEFLDYYGMLPADFFTFMR